MFNNFVMSQPVWSLMSLGMDNHMNYMFRKI